MTASLVALTFLVTPAAIAGDVAEKQALNIDIIGPERAVPLEASCRNVRRLADEVKL